MTLWPALAEGLALFIHIDRLLRYTVNQSAFKAIRYNLAVIFTEVKIGGERSVGFAICVGRFTQ